MGRSVIMSVSAAAVIVVPGAVTAWFHYGSASSNVLSAQGGSIALNASDRGGSTVTMNQLPDHGPGGQTPKPADNAASAAKPAASALPERISHAGAGGNANPTPTHATDFSQYDSYKTSQTGLSQDIVVGSGAEAVDGKKLTMNYRGCLTNGTIFDESYKRRQPFSFTLGAGQVISGWDIGVKNMKVGGKRRLVLPPALGYGANSAGSAIPPIRC